MTQMLNTELTDVPHRIDKAGNQTSPGEMSDWNFDVRLMAKCLTLLIGTLVVTGALANYAVYNVAPHPDHGVVGNPSR